jgi:hypothetical protein
MGAIYLFICLFIEEFDTLSMFWDETDKWCTWYTEQGKEKANNFISILKRLIPK